MSRADRTPYVDTFFRELSPVWLNYVAALNGIEPRKVDAAFTYLELGCGFGQTVTVNAAAFPRGNFHACDINEAHVSAARRYAETVGVRNVEFHHASFDELDTRDLPTFDFVVLHGVYSWVDDAAKCAIRNIIRRASKAGGLVYLSYNCYPGWAIEVPLRRLFGELAQTGCTDMRARIGTALDALRRLDAADLRYFDAHAPARAAVFSYTGAPIAYLAHELLNESWQALYSLDVADDMHEAGLRYVGSATLADNHLELVMSADAARSIASLPTSRQRRLAEDFAVNRYFRRDVFVRGPEPVVSSGSAPYGTPLDRVIVGSIADPARIETTARVPRGVLTFDATFVGELRTLMQRGSMQLGDLMRALSRRACDEAAILRNLVYLVAAGVLAPFARVHRSEDTCGDHRVADNMLADAAKRDVPRAIASEVLGNGVLINPADLRARDRLHPLLARVGIG